MPPNPDSGSGLHRYGEQPHEGSLIGPTIPALVFLLFEEPIGGSEIPDGTPEYGAKSEQLRNWDALAFGEKFGLKLVGADFIFSVADHSSAAA